MPFPEDISLSVAAFKNESTTVPLSWINADAAAISNPENQECVMHFCFSFLLVYF